MELVASILVAFACGIVYRYFNLKTYVRESTSIIGSTLILLIGKTDAIFFVVLLIGGCLLIKSRKLENPRYVFAFATAYQVFFNTLTYLRIRANDVSNNSIDCLIFLSTMKLVIVSYEIHEIRTKLKESESPNRCSFGVLRLESEPSTLDIVCYMTCFAGLVTGPFYKYRTYSDMIKEPYKPIKALLVPHLAKTALFGFLWWITMKSYDVEYFRRNDIENDALHIRFLYVYLVTLHQVFRFTFAWLISEASCLLLGLGMYPVECKSNCCQGPTVELPIDPTKGSDKAEQKYDIKTMNSMDAYDFLCSPSFSATFAAWNRAVQWWLVHFIYRSDLLPRKMRALRIMAVFLMSALWHGIELDNFLLVPGIVLGLTVDKYCMQLIDRNIQSDWIKKLYLAFHWAFLKLFGVSFVLTSFVLHDYRLVWNILRQTYFAAYIFPVAIGVLCKVFCFFQAAPLRKSD